MKNVSVRADWHVCCVFAAIEERMSPGPGRIDIEYTIDLQRPRDIASAEFNKWRRLLSSQLHSHHGRKTG
jgi:hypothetical protein